MRCDGENCGGTWRNAIYRVDPPEPSTGDSVLGSGQSLRPGQSRRSPNGRYDLVYQGDGNLVLYAGSQALWTSGTAGQSPGEVAMQPDGNLVVYNSGRARVWSTGTQGQSGAFLRVQDDANLVVYSRGGRFALWARR